MVGGAGAAADFRFRITRVLIATGPKRVGRGGGSSPAMETGWPAEGEAARPGLNLGGRWLAVEMCNASALPRICDE